MTKIAILGGGSWGTALAIVLSRTHQPHEVALWMREKSLAQTVASTRENQSYLPGCRIPEAVTITSDLGLALQKSEIVVGAIPSAHARSIYTHALPYLDPANIILVSATKGLEPSTHLRMSEVIAQLFTTNSKPTPPIAVLSGPSFALETAMGDPTVVVVAAQSSSSLLGIKDREPGVVAKAEPASTSPLQSSTRHPHEGRIAEHIQTEFAGPTLRLYTNDDILGVELAGAMKNVIAIAAGVCHGLGLGTNVVAALITRGLAEISRLATTLGARPETLSGLAGLGDLVLTCTGALSRNRQMGIQLGRGRPLAEILSSTNTVAEGVGTAAALLAIAASHQIDLPITSEVEAILHHNKSPLQAMIHTMERPQRPE
jgi:glycerol-3-phosphate dehydrogenase (NAD(P)+)